VGRTIPSIAMVYLDEISVLKPFRNALRRSDQLALDELFAAVHKHLAEAAYAAHPLPLEIFLRAMLLEDHKEVMSLRNRIDGTSTA